MDDESVEFSEEKPSPSVSEKAKAEVKRFENGTPPPNTMVIPLWGGGHISFNPDNSVPVFAFLSLFLLVICILILVAIMQFGKDLPFIEKIADALGHAITGLVGAVVGSAAAAKKRK